MRINSLEQIQKYVNVANTFTYSQLNAHEQIAFTSHINQYFTTEFCDEILGSESEAQPLIDAKKFVEGTLIYFAMWQWTQTGEVIIGDLGILRNENENAKAAYSGQIKKMEAAFHENGLVYISELIKVIEFNPESFEGFENQPAFEERNQLIIKKTLDFHKRQYLARPFLLFPILVQCQIDTIQTYLLSELTAEIIQQFINGISEDDPNKDAKEFALNQTKNAIVNFTLKLAFERNLVKLTPQGIVENRADKDTDQQIYEAGKDTKIDQQILRYEQWGQNYISKASSILIDAGVLPQPIKTTMKTFIA
jgi:hypothetical protein